MRGHPWDKVEGSSMPVEQAGGRGGRKRRNENRTEEVTEERCGDRFAGSF
jgi:hypothetical protein